LKAADSDVYKIVKIAELGGKDSRRQV